MPFHVNVEVEVRWPFSLTLPKENLDLCVCVRRGLFPPAQRPCWGHLRVFWSLALPFLLLEGGGWVGCCSAFGCGCCSLVWLLLCSLVRVAVFGFELLSSCYPCCWFPSCCSYRYHSLLWLSCFFGIVVLVIWWLFLLSSWCCFHDLFWLCPALLSTIAFFLPLRMFDKSLCCCCFHELVLLKSPLVPFVDHWNS